MSKLFVSNNPTVLHQFCNTKLGVPYFNNGRSDMTRAEALALINTQSTCAQIRMVAMLTANAECTANGVSAAYDEAAFDALIVECGLDRSSVIKLLREATP